MSEAAFEALVEKREELVAQVRVLQSEIYILNEAMRMLGCDPSVRRAPRRRFARGELIAMVGRAEREGHHSPSQITAYILQANGWDVTDKKLTRDVRATVKECLSRLKLRESVGNAQASERQQALVET